MSDNRSSKVGKVLGIVSLAAVGGYVGYKLFTSALIKKKLAEAYNEGCTIIDQRFGWNNLPTPVALALLIGIRNKLRRSNLSDTQTAGSQPMVPTGVPASLAYRTADGTFNDLKCPFMGSAGTRFGRNAPIELTRQEPPETIMTPSPRVVSTELLTRKNFTPATTLNLLAAAWLQFQIRDWFSHGKAVKDNPWLLALGPGDSWHENPMKVLRTMPDPTRSGTDAGRPETHINTETHWWDASQIYGSDLDYREKVRTHIDGKIHLDKNNLVHPETDALVQLGSAALAGWWVGLELFFTLFSLEHNAICDELKQQYPTWGDEALFEHARLVNAALIAKIHTVEWTTAILGHPALQIGMRSNWWGLAGERIANLFGRLSKSELISGIPGSDVDHFGVPYSLTEEFVAVYRMHPLIPDDITFWSLETGGLLQRLGFQDIAGNNAQKICDDVQIQDLFYSFGIMNPGAVQLHNYPNALQHFIRPDGIAMDLAAHDIMRCRELGVPRYTKFREVLHLRPVRTFEELTDNAEWREEMRRVYNNEIDAVDLIVGLFAETPPKGFGFSDTAFRIFILMASRRLNSDRFFTTDFTEEVYSKAGMDWIRNNTMSSVLLRHFPRLAPALEGLQNAFAPWNHIAQA
jgi:hypothetical protein